MKAFLATLQAGSFSEAGRQLGIAPSVITKRVGQLEQSLRTTLLKRSTRRLTPTDVGLRYFEANRQIVREYDDLAASILQSPSELEGQLRIMAPATMTPIDVVQILASFQAKYPQMTLDAVLVDRNVNPAEEGYDVALTHMPSSYEGVVEEPLSLFQRALCAAPSYLARRGRPRSLRELAHHDCIVFSPVGNTWTLQGPNGLATVTVRPHLATNNIALVFDSLCQGNGIAIVSRLAAAEKIANGELVEILTEFRVPDLWLKALVPCARENFARVQLLLDHIREASKECSATAKPIRLPKDSSRGNAASIAPRRRLSSVSS